MPAFADSFALGDDLPIRRLGIGTMSLTGPGTWGAPAGPAAARALLRRAVELGVGLVDTADAYGPDVSETLIAEALHPYPEQLVVATKGGLRRQGPNRWSRDGRPAWLRDACEGSLRRLRIDRIDLYQLHAIDPAVPIEESLGALAELRREGKIRHIGVCNVSESELVRARAVVPVVAVQNRYNLADRASEDVLDLCRRERLAFLPWAPLAKGALGRAGGALRRVAAKYEASTAQISIAWLLQRGDVVVPIPGTSSPAHLEENVAGATVQLTSADVAALDGQTFAGLATGRAVRRARRALGRIGSGS